MHLHEKATQSLTYIFLGSEPETIAWHSKGMKCTLVHDVLGGQTLSFHFSYPYIPVSERARANSIQTQHVHVHSKCFTIPESYEKVNSYKERKNNNCNTEKLLKAIAK